MRGYSNANARPTTLSFERLAHNSRLKEAVDERLRENKGNKLQASRIPNNLCAASCVLDEWVSSKDGTQNPRMLKGSVLKEALNNQRSKIR